MREEVPSDNLEVEEEVWVYDRGQWKTFLAAPPGRPDPTAWGYDVDKPLVRLWHEFNLGVAIYRHPAPDAPGNCRYLGVFAGESFSETCWVFLPNLPSVLGFLREVAPLVTAAAVTYWDDQVNVAAFHAWQEAWQKKQR